MAEKFPQGAAPQENKMGVLPIGRLLTNMAVPMMISMLVQACYNVVDSVFVAQISEDALNAVSLAFPLQNLMIAFGAGTAVGINALLSRSLGEKNQAMADRAANTGIFLALCNFALFALIGIFFSRTFFELQAGGEQVIIDYGVWKKGKTKFDNISPFVILVTDGKGDGLYEKGASLVQLP